MLPKLLLKYLMYVPFVSRCPFFLILSIRFVIQERSTSRVINEGREYRRIYYQCTKLSISFLTCPFSKFIHDCLGQPHLSKFKNNDYQT